MGYRWSNLQEKNPRKLYEALDIFLLHNSTEGRFEPWWTSFYQRKLRSFQWNKEVRLASSSEHVVFISLRMSRTAFGTRCANRRVRYIFCGNTPRKSHSGIILNLGLRLLLWWVIGWSFESAATWFNITTSCEIFIDFKMRAAEGAASLFLLATFNGI